MQVTWNASTCRAEHREHRRSSVPGVPCVSSWGTVTISPAADDAYHDQLFSVDIFLIHLFSSRSYPAAAQLSRADAERLVEAGYLAEYTKRREDSGEQLYLTSDVGGMRATQGHCAHVSE